MEIETFPTMIQDRKGVYWLAFSRETGKPNKFDTFLMSSADAKRWSDPVRITRGSANNNYIDFIQDASDIYWLAFTSTRSGNEDIFVMGSYDANTWSLPQQLTFNTINRTRDFKCDYKTLIQDSEGMLSIVYGCAKRPKGLWYVKGYAKPKFGYAAGAYEIIETPLGEAVLKQITTDTYPQIRPSWSPDGSNIVYISRRDNKGGDIWITDSTGRGKREAIFNTTGGTLPSWRSDGMIVYTHEIDGQDVSVVNPATGQRLDLTTRENDQFFSSYSPDGSKILYVSNEAGSNDIYAMNADTSGNARLTFDETHENAPSWSPDGGKIAFESNIYGNWDIFVMDSDGNNTVRLTNNVANEGHPSFSPDGKKIVYMSDESGVFKLYVIDADGTGNKMRLTKGPAFDVYPYWGLNGNSIVFESNRAGNQDVWVIDFSGVNLSYLQEDVEYSAPFETPHRESEDNAQTDKKQSSSGFISKIKELIWGFIERIYLIDDIFSNNIRSNNGVIMGQIAGGT
jgi:Tol biopolymer transport system component